MIDPSDLSPTRLCQKVFASAGGVKAKMIGSIRR
jgi:hypothetical protein